MVCFQTDHLSGLVHCKATEEAVPVQEKGQYRDVNKKASIKISPVSQANNAFLYFLLPSSFWPVTNNCIKSNNNEAAMK